MIPRLIIHGGCGRFEGAHASSESYRAALRPIMERAYRKLQKKGAREAVFYGMRLLEDAEIFNAGYGSKLQRDGAARMSASFMDGTSNRFSGVINVENVRHPVDIARILNRRKHTVIAGTPAEAFARKEDIPHFNPVAPHRLREYEEQKEGESGTCGIVAVDATGYICVATSTGGIGYEVPGRVGDTPTVAGNYASDLCGISCTGKGEHIINLAVAARVATAYRYTGDLQHCIDDVIAEGNERKYRFGIIALDRKGHVVVGQTRKVTTLAAWHDGEQLKDFTEA